MSTYNGEKYLREQIESLVSQKYVNIRIIIRDDGSKDSTISILDEYCNKYSFITVMEEPNCGVSKSFDKLCRYACSVAKTDFYAFCDQDDVWEDDKLLAATRRLVEFPEDEPNLYFSNLKMVDENLNYIQDQYQPGEVKIGSPMALVQVFAYGCTCVFNRKGLEEFCAIPENNMCHDHWIFEICTYLGNVYYDEYSHINYRRHGSNVSVVKSKGFYLLVQRLHKLITGVNNNFEISAKQLLFFENLLKRQDYDYIYKIAHYRDVFRYKMELLFSKYYKTGNIAKDLTIIFRLLVNKL